MACEIEGKKWSVSLCSLEEFLLLLKFWKRVCLLDIKLCIRSHRQWGAESWSNTILCHWWPHRIIYSVPKISPRIQPHPASIPCCLLYIRVTNRLQHGNVKYCQLWTNIEWNWCLCEWHSLVHWATEYHFNYLDFPVFKKNFFPSQFVRK